MRMPQIGADQTRSQIKKLVPLEIKKVTPLATRNHGCLKRTLRRPTRENVLLVLGGEFILFAYSLRHNNLGSGALREFSKPLRPKISRLERQIQRLILACFA